MATTTNIISAEMTPERKSEVARKASEEFSTGERTEQDFVNTQKVVPTYSELPFASI